MSRLIDAELSSVSTMTTVTTTPTVPISFGTDV